MWGRNIVRLRFVVHERMIVLLQHFVSPSPVPEITCRFPYDPEVFEQLNGFSTRTPSRCSPTARLLAYDFFQDSFLERLAAVLHLTKTRTRVCTWVVDVRSQLICHMHSVHQSSYPCSPISCPFSTILRICFGNESAVCAGVNHVALIL